jgi:hypothetical protein
MTYNRFTFGHSSDTNGSKSQSLLQEQLKRLIPDTPVMYNYKLQESTERETNQLKHYEFDVSSTNHFVAYKRDILSSAFYCF